MRCYLCQGHGEVHCEVATDYLAGTGDDIINREFVACPSCHGSGENIDSMADADRKDYFDER